MKSTTKIKIITAALIASALFLIIGADYLPHFVAWLPMLVTATFALSSKVYVTHVTRWLDKIIPID